jgi:hypothetical protein
MQPSASCALMITLLLFYYNKPNDLDMDYFASRLTYGYFEGKDALLKA